VIMYAYHTDNKGIYSKSGKEQGVQNWHGRLHGWCRTDTLGHYEIHTIRPASYPNSTAPAHIHGALKEPSGNMLPITDFVFKDDKFVTGSYKPNSRLKGGSGIVDVKRRSDGFWVGERNIIVN
jgi:protocatechuate 3,4-dioxygenase, beta subunit